MNLEAGVAYRLHYTKEEARVWTKEAKRTMVKSSVRVGLFQKKWITLREKSCESLHLLSLAAITMVK